MATIGRKAMSIARSVNVLVFLAAICMIGAIVVGTF